MGTSSDSAGSPKWGTAKAQTTSAVVAGALTGAKIEQIVGAFVQGLQQTPETGFGPPPPDIPGIGPSGPDLPGLNPIAPALPTVAPGETPPSAPTVAPSVQPLGTIGNPSWSSSRGGGGGGGGGRGGRGGGGGRSGGGVRGAAYDLAQFINTVAEAGLAQALADIGLTSLEDKSPTEIASTITAELCGPNSTIDQVDLHHAMAETMDKIMGEAKEFKDCELALKQAAPTLPETLSKLFGNYIYERFCTVSYANVLAKIGADRVEAAMGQIKDYIASKVKSLSHERGVGSIHWKGAEGFTIVNKILQQTETVFSP